MISFWEKSSLLTYDYIVIGSGIVGLNTGINLKLKYPNSRVLILERGILPTGASTRNAGFACMGSLSELAADLDTLSETELVNLFMQRKQGIDLLRQRLGDAAIGYQANGSHELLSRSEIKVLDRMDHFNALLKEVSDQAVFRRNDDVIKQYGCSSRHFAACIENTCEGELHTGKMMRSLIDYAIMQGVEIKTGVPVTRFEASAKEVQVIVDDPYRAEGLQFTTRHVLICTNAFTPQFFPDLDIQPGRGQVILTKPIPGLKLKGIFHFDEGYYYFRELEGRILFGGGRNLDFETEQTDEIALNQTIINRLHQWLTEAIIPGIPFEIDMKWSGIMAFGADKKPIVQSFGERVHGAFRMGGMGVALGSLVAQQLADLPQV